jgi:hypothetical protein
MAYEDPFLDLPRPWRERDGVRGSSVYSVYSVCPVYPVFSVRRKGLYVKLISLTPDIRFRRVKLSRIPLANTYLFY